MIKIAKDFAQIPVGLTTETCRRAIEALIDAGGASIAKGNLYRDSCKEELQRLYHGKCAYCESKLGVSSVARIDHFRPQRGGRNRPHNGYYWLTYEWTNLIPACDICNGKSNKSDRFPLENEVNRITQPFSNNEEKSYSDFKADSDHLCREHALLIHPELDNPLEHIAFTPTGRAIGLTMKGRTTIQVCGLNREQLIFARKKIVEGIRNEIRTLFFDLSKGSINTTSLLSGLKKVFKQTLFAQKNNKEYSAFSYLIFKDFERFITCSLPSKIQKVVRIQFQFFQEELKR